jgi:WD40 repeat protein
VWDVQARQVWRTLNARSGNVTRLVIHPDGRAVAAVVCTYRTGSPRPGEVRCWDMPSHQVLHEGWPALPEVYRRGMDVNVWSVAFSPDGTLLAVGESGGVLLVNWPAGDLLGVLDRGARSLAFSPDGRRLAGVPQGIQVFLWDVPPDPQAKALQKPQVLRGHKRGLKALAFAPDGATLATGGLDETVILWDVASGCERASYDWKVGAVYALAFAPDGMTLAVGGEKGIVICDIDPL